MSHMHMRLGVGKTEEPGPNSWFVWGFLYLPVLHGLCDLETGSQGLLFSTTVLLNPPAVFPIAVMRRDVAARGTLSGFYGVG